MHIYQAAYKALKEIGKPTHHSLIRSHIEKNAYYDFGDEKSKSALDVELRRRSINVVINKAISEKLFYQAAPATFGLVEWLGEESTTNIASITNQDRDADVIEILRSSREATEKKQLILARIGQGKFRKDLLDLWESKCAVTGGSLTIRASHIKPWKDSDDGERLDPNNGLPLVATLDSLFDAKLISFGSEGEIILNDIITKQEQECLGVSVGMKLRRKPSSELEHYLAQHRKQLKSQLFHSQDT